MVWCLNCARDCRAEPDHDTGCVCCSECGKVIYQVGLDESETFIKDAGGGSRFAGNYVRSIQIEYSRALENGKSQIHDLMFKLEISDGSLGDKAIKFYTIALERSFTRGRRTSHVAAACLYTACRVNDKPYLLIDFAVWLSVNVYVLGAVYLQLCKLLSLDEHGFVQKPVDPSLFMHRFASALVKGCEYERRRVGRMALKIVASMKRDWMQTGRKPSGICGAALYISSLSHGLNHSKMDVVRIVHICEATLTKRLVEFENTASGSLTIEEFEKIAEEFDKENLGNANSESCTKEKIEMLCQHKGKQPHFAHGLCRNCYDDFVQLSGGLNGGSEPPAFQQAELQRSTNQGDGMQEKDPHQDIENFERSSSSTPDERGGKGGDTIDPPPVSDDEESDNLSDIDDDEVDCYLNNEIEKNKKTIVWEMMNKEFIQEQAAKEAAIASGALLPDDVLAARKLKRQQKKALESQNAGPAKTPAEATLQMLTKKRLSTRINYDVLDKLFDETQPVAKKSRTDSYDDDDDPNVSRQEEGNNKEGNEEEITAFVEDAEEEEYAEEDAEFYNGNAEEMYNFDNGQDNWDDEEF